jgi:hypothetical protein
MDRQRWKYVYGAHVIMIQQNFDHAKLWKLSTPSDQKVLTIAGMLLPLDDDDLVVTYPSFCHQYRDLLLSETLDLPAISLLCFLVGLLSSN